MVVKEEVAFFIRPSDIGRLFRYRGSQRHLVLVAPICEVRSSEPQRKMTIVNHYNFGSIKKFRTHSDAFFNSYGFRPSKPLFTQALSIL